MIEEIIREAANILPVTWPIKSFIATNPLWGLNALSFEEALRKIKSFSAIEGVMPFDFYHKLYDHKKIINEDIDRAIFLWMSQQNAHQEAFHSQEISVESICKQLFLNEEVAVTANTVSCPLVSVRIGTLVKRDLTIDIQKKMIEFFMFYFDEKNRFSQGKAGLYKAWSEYEGVHVTKEDVVGEVEYILKEFNISQNDYLEYSSVIFFKLIGWCGLIKWLEQRPSNPFLSSKVSLIDVVLIWLSYEKRYARKYQSEFARLSLSSFRPENFDQTSRGLDRLTCHLLWQRAFEYAYERELLARLESRSCDLVRLEDACSVQAIFCIDTRSEGLRYELEKIKDYDTYGFAGFFGFVFECQDAINGSKSLQCPALFAPDAVVKLNQDFNSLSKKTTGFLSLLQKIKKGFLSSFVFVEIFGYWYALLMMLKSFLPQFFQKILKKLGQSRHDRLVTAEISSQEISKAFTLEVKVNNALQFLKAIGLVGNFAPLVFVCGHGSETDNNPYQASLDCGACGGNAGFSNARVACQILNDPAVRSELSIKGIDIPSTTYFVAGFHNTTRDDVVVSRSYLPSFLEEKLEKLAADLKKAASSLRQQRLKDIPGNSSAINRSVYWSELIPEMGLINNAALIIAPRELTRGLNLDRRVFLHSYDTLNDTDGQLLTAIFSGPLIVAHWINAQYYFSTTDPLIYGSGNKMLHNPLGTLGVMEGNLSDLKIGLPWQSVAFGDQMLHQPLRLLVVVYAPQSRVDKVLEKNPNIKAIFDGQWAHLRVIEFAG